MYTITVKLPEATTVPRYPSASYITASAKAQHSVVYKDTSVQQIMDKLRQEPDATDTMYAKFQR